MSYDFDARYEDWKRKNGQSESEDSFNFDERYSDWRNRNGYVDMEREFAEKDMQRVLREREALHAEAAAYPYATKAGRTSTYASNKQAVENINADFQSRWKPASGYLTGGTEIQSPGYGAKQQADSHVVAMERLLADKRMNEEKASREKEMRMYERGLGQYQTSKVIDDYSYIQQQPDFLEVSANRDFQNPTKEQIYAQDWTVHADEENFKPAPYHPVNDRLGLFLSASQEDRDRAYLPDRPTEWEKTLDEGFSGSWDYLTDTEIGQYYYLLNRDGKEAADKYLDDMTVELNKRQAIDEQQKTSQKVRDASTLEKLAMSAASVPAQIAGSVVSFVDDLRQGAKGEAINPYSGERFMSRYAATVRGTQAEILDEATGGWKIPGIEFGLGDLYQAGMSILDMAAGSQLGAFGYGTVMGMGAATSEAERLYQEGATDEQIQMGAALAGIAEMLFEEVSLDKLINMPNADSIGQVVKNVLIQGGIEASEEGATEIANIITNAIVMGKDSDFVKSVEENGGDIKQAIYDKLGEVGKAMAGGFAAGAGSGGAVSGINYAGDVHVMQDQGKPIVESYGGRERLMALAKEASEGADSRTQRQLQSQSDTLMDKSKSSAKQGSIERTAGRLFRTTQNAMSQANQNAMTDHLVENGYSQNTAKRIAKDLGMQERGVILSEHEQKFLERHIDDKRVQAAYDAASEVSTGKNIDFATDIISNLPIESEAGSDSNVRLHDEQDMEEDDYRGKAFIEGAGEAEILRPAGIENGKLMVETADGQRIENSSITHQSVQDQAIYDAIGQVAKTNEDVDFLYRMYENSGLDGRVYGMAIRHAYDTGIEHQPPEQVVRDEFISMLPRNVVQYVYNRGVERSEEILEQKKAANKNRVFPVSKNPGVRFADGQEHELNKRQKASFDTINVFAKGICAEFEVFVSEVENGRHVGDNGSYDPKTGKFRIDLNAGIDGNSLMLFTASHELTHYIADRSPEKFQELADFLMEEYGKRNVSVERLIQNQIAKAKSNNRTIDRATAYEEMIADSMESMLADPKATEKFLKLKNKDPGFWQTIKDWFADLAKRIREAYKNVKPDSEEGKIVAQMQDSIDRIQDLFVEGLVGASENSSNSSDRKLDDDVKTVGDVLYSTRSFSEQVDAVKANTFEGNSKYLYLGTTSPKLVNILGLPKIPMLMTQKHTYSIAVSDKTAKTDGRYSKDIHYHDLGWDVVKQFPHLIKNPVAIVKSNLDPDNARFVVVTDQTDNIGRPIIVAFEPNGTGKYYNLKIPSTISLSGYGRNNFHNYMIRAKNEGRILYINKKSSHRKLTNPGVQFPNVLQSYDYTTNLAQFRAIVKDKFKGTIFEHSGEVKFSSRNAEDRLLTKQLYADNNASTNDPDIRSSDRTNQDAQRDALNRKLQRENKALREDVSYLREIVKLQKQVTNGTVFTKSSVESAARYLKKKAGATGSSKELAGYLNEFYQYIAKGENLTWEYLSEEAEPVVNWLREHTKKVRDSYAQDILDSLHGRRFRLDDSQKEESAYLYGSYNNYRKANMGRFIVTDKANTTLDQLWQELSAEYPAYFDADISASDMPAELANIISRLQDSYGESDMYADELTNSLLRNVYDSYWRVSTLRTAADKYEKEKTAAQISHDKKLAQKDAKIASLNSRIRRLKQKHDDQMLSVNEKLEEQQARYQESRAKGIDSRRRTEMRGKIKKVVGDLNKLLLNPTKERHIPEELRAPVAEVLEAVNFDTVGAEERIGKLLKQLEETDDLKKKTEISNRISHVSSMGEHSAERLKKLSDAYERIAKNTDPVIAGAFDPDVHSYIETVKSEVGDTAIRDMSLEQLRMVYNMFTMVKTTISKANKSFAENMKMGIEEQALDVIRQVHDVGGEHQYSLKMLEELKKFGFSNLKPLQFFQIIGSDTMEDLFKNLRSGEDVTAIDIGEAKKYATASGEKYGIDKWDQDAKHTFESRSGDKFDLTLEQIMSIYAYSKRGDIALDHLRNGGIVLDKSTVFVKKIAGINVKFNPNMATAYSLSDETIGNIIDTLTDDQKAYVDTMQQYLSKDMAAKGNEVSMKMYGIKLFGEKFYFPLMSSSDFLTRASDAESRKEHGEVRIKNKGMTKATTPKAGNPVVLANFSDVWSDHVNEMSMYHGLVLPMEDFEKVWNYHTAFNGEENPKGVRATIANAYGSAANGYIKKLLQDINGGTYSDPDASIANKMTSTFKKGAVLASASVVIQQPSAIVRAMYMIDPKYFAGNSFGVKNHKQKWNEVKKYAPIAIIKEIGGFDTNTGAGIKDYIFGTENKLDEALGRAPGYADEMGWIMIWEACKKEVAAKNPSLKGEELLKAAGDRFTDVIINTQVYDSVMTRSGIMRSKDGLTKMVTAFMAEPTTSLNMIVSAAVQAKRGKKGLARKAIGAVVASQVFNAVLVSLVYAARDDDDDETYAEKYIESLTGKILEGINPVMYIPIAKDIASIVQGYNVERTDLSIFADIVNASKKLGSENVSAYRKVEDFAGSIANLFGIPVKNIMRDARALYQMFAISPGDTTKAGVGYAVKSAIPKWAGGGEVSKQQKLYDAILSGDKEQIRRIQAQYSSDSSLHTAIRSELKKRDPRIAEAAKLYMSGKTNDYTKLFREIQREGHFSFDDIQKAINSAMTDLKNGKTPSAEKPASEQLLRSDMLLNSIVGGSAADREAARKELHDYYVSQGELPWKADNAIASSVTSQVRSAYMDGSMDRSKAEEILSEYGSSGLLIKWDFEKAKGWNWSDRERQYRTNGISKAELRNAYMDIEGKTAAEADAYIRWLDLQSEYPTIEITQREAEKFYDIAQPAGIPFETFREFLTMASGVTGVKDEDGNTISGSKKKAVMEIIDSLPISNAQKDALYYANDWAPNKIGEAPWH